VFISLIKTNVWQGIKERREKALAFDSLEAKSVRAQKRVEFRQKKTTRFLTTHDHHHLQDKPTISFFLSEILMIRSITSCRRLKLTIFVAHQAMIVNSLLDRRLHYRCQTSLFLMCVALVDTSLG